MDRGPTGRAGRARALRVLLVLALGALLLLPAAAAAKVRVVEASADAAVSARAPQTARGTAKTLTVDGKPARRAYLRFRLTGLTKRVITQATVWVHLSRKERWRGIQAATTNGKAWSERRLTWRRRPAAAPPIGSITNARGRWKKIDVTGLVRTNGRVDVVLTSTRTNGVVLDSGERPSRAPRLHLMTKAERQPSFPLRTAVYDSGFPEEWETARPIAHPARGEYDGADPGVVEAQLGDLDYGSFGAAMTPWEGPDTDSDERLAGLLADTDAAHNGLRWAVEDIAEITGRPTRGEIAARLLALDVAHGRDDAYLRVRGRPVVFVPIAPGDGCGALRRWVGGNARQRAYLVFQTWPGFESCTGAKPSDWWSVAPDAGPVRVRHSSYAVSPGSFTSAETSARKPRDLPGWYAEIRGMVGSRARFQIVDSYNGWGGGTAVEPATEWASPSGHGQYLDALHADGTAPPDTATVTAAAGDIACDDTAEQRAGDSDQECQQDATAGLVQSLDPAAVFVLGDLEYGASDLEQFQKWYDPSWGRFKSITYPVIGNHEYADPGANGYFTYFGARAGTRGEGWYSVDVGGWHVVVLNSECKSGIEKVSCASGSPQETWLREDLAAHAAACTLALFHRPRFTGGQELEAPAMGTVYRDLYRAGAEVILNGHQHQYERFLPQAPDRTLDVSGGLTEMVVGTGGKSHIPPIPAARKPNTAASNADTFGVLRLELHPLSWSARFVPAPGLGSYTDTVSGDCH